MTFEALDQWRVEAGLRINEACELLGISWDRWNAMRRKNEVPRTVYLARLAIYHRLDGEECSQ